MLDVSMTTLNSFAVKIAISLDPIIALGKMLNSVNSSDLVKTQKKN
jgi:hypothetical protein